MPLDYPLRHLSLLLSLLLHFAFAGSFVFSFAAVEECIVICLDQSIPNLRIIRSPLSSSTLLSISLWRLHCANAKSSFCSPGTDLHRQLGCSGVAFDVSLDLQSTS